MAREYFVFQRNYFEIIKALDDKARLEMYDAICDFALNQNESKIDGLQNALFSLIKPDILKGLKKYENGVKGGRGKKANGKQNESKTKANEKQTESKEETTFPLKETTKEKVTQKEKRKETNTPFVQEESPPISPPRAGEGQEEFFKVYCQFKKAANGSYPQIDFIRLKEEFDRSSALRKMFSWKIILDSYESIIAGNFRDKVDGQAEAREMMADRERYYAGIRTAAEKKAEAIVKKLMTFERYAEIDKRLRTIPMDQGKAEAKGDMIKMARLEQELNRLKAERSGILAINGLTEEDIEVRETCRKCHDTGYLEDGTLCACYGG